MTRQEAQAIYRAGEETVVRVLVELSTRVDQLTADFALLKAENIALRVECGTLRERVRTLEGKLAKDSHNSHMPPSSDGLFKPAPKCLRAPSQRPSGGQPGHPGHTLRMVEKPDRTVTHRVERCQVHDLPEPSLPADPNAGGAPSKAKPSTSSTASETTPRASSRSCTTSLFPSTTTKPNVTCA